MTQELKPCPFCGGEALLLGSYEHGYFVECHDCFAKTSNFGSEGKAESIVAWNTRANDDDGGYDPLGDDDYDW